VYTYLLFCATSIFQTRPSKNNFVNLNGLFARLTGRRLLNGTVKLNNGMLGFKIGDADMTTTANEISVFSDYLSEQNIPFLYIQMPGKESLDGQSFPVGVASSGNKNADNLLSLLSAEGVKTLDLRPLISQTQEMLEQHFYKTDHHWNSDGAFVGFQEVLCYLHKLFPASNIDLTYAQKDQWERHIINDWYLGSQGRRTGIFFGGIDPLIWHTPKFETEISCSIPARGEFYRGNFAEANIRTKYIEEKDYFVLDSYNVYIGADYPLVQHRNLNAPSSLKLLMLKDSFTRPLQSFLSTVFQEIDVIDPRSFSQCTIAEYVQRTAPDVVILSINPSHINTEAYRNFGIDKAISINLEKSPYELVIQENSKIEMSDDNYNHAAYPIEGNAVYRVSFDGVDILEGQADGVGLQLYDKTTKTVLENTIFDLTYCEATDGFSWIVRTPDTQDEFQLLLYAGIYRSTAGNSVVYRDVTIEKLFDIDS
ncbi:MAG: hypothetical protein J1F18_15370, partial [Lachnospiraceae bacterium]|nr:hypothetical protein [Lachnospiraceae bacterium]